MSSFTCEWWLIVHRFRFMVTDSSAVARISLGMNNVSGSKVIF